jgi:hypothetical protein
MQGWMEAFVIVATIAIVMQMAILLGMYIQLRATTQQLSRVTSDLQRKIDPILTHTNRILEISEEKIGSIVTDAAEMTRIARSQAQKVDRVVTEALERMRGQIVRVDSILTGTLEAVEDAGLRFRRTVFGPLQQASAVLKGIRAGIDFIRSQRTGRAAAPSPTTDEELFI